MITPIRKPRTDWNEMNTAPAQRLPFTVADRSPVDGIRIRWGGLGSSALGVGLFFTADPVGIFFGFVLLGLGLATWILSSFGQTWWYDIPKPQRYVVSTGAVTGLVALVVFLGGFILVAWIIQLVARNT